MDSNSNAAIRTDEALADAPAEPYDRDAQKETLTVSTPPTSTPELPKESHLAAPTPMMIWLKRSGPRYLVRIMALVVAVLLWETASGNGFHFYINFENIPAPSVVGAALGAELAGEEFYLHILHSLERVAIAYV
ncbi:MAG: hypothetical protein NZ728_04205, partial [Oleiphilaceae bacterium]|nr:hypothetical protein [Oleiphilaceae bacterium]